MKALSIIFYCIAGVLLIVSCFTASVTLTWWLGGAAVLALVIGCMFQYKAYRHRYARY